MTQGCNHLFDEADLAIGRGFEGPQVAGIESERGQLPCRTSDDQGVAIKGAVPAIGVTSPNCSSWANKSSLISAIFNSSRRDTRTSLRRAKDSGLGSPSEDKATEGTVGTTASIGGGFKPRSIASRCSPITRSGK